MPHVDFIGPDGEKWPSATELTSLLPQAWLMSWYRSAVKKHGWRGWQLCKAQSKRGTVIGTEVHGLIEGFIKKEPFAVSGKHNSQIFADALFDAVNPLVEQYIAIEPHLIDTECRIHGTADMIVQLKNRPGLFVGDWKTAAGKSDTHPIQLAIYKMCWDAEHPHVPLEGGFIARVDKKSKKLGVKIDEYLNLQRYYPVVKALREIYSYSNSLGAYKE